MASKRKAEASSSSSSSAHPASSASDAKDKRPKLGSSGGGVGGAAGGEAPITIKMIGHAGMGGFFAGESPNGYAATEKKATVSGLTATGDRAHLINPRRNCKAVLLGGDGDDGEGDDGDADESSFAGPVTMPKVCKFNCDVCNCDATLLKMSDATRGRAIGVGSFLTYLRLNTDANDVNERVVIVAAGPGGENVLSAVAGLVQDMKTRKSRPLGSGGSGGASTTKKQKDELAAAAAAYAAAAPSIDKIAGYVFLTPITYTKGRIPNEDRMAPFLAIPVGTPVLILTGDKDTNNELGLEVLKKDMPCRATTTMHIVKGATHNPFDSTPVKDIAMKNRVTQDVLRKFLAECVPGAALPAAGSSSSSGASSSSLRSYFAAKPAKDNAGEGAAGAAAPTSD